MYGWYAPDPRMRANVGIRRRLAPLLDNSRPEIELIHALLLSLPGSPCLYYGDEIGMGDNIWLTDRDAVRTPDAVDARPQRRLLRASTRASSTCPSSAASSTTTTTSTSRRRWPRSASLLHWVRGMLQIRGRHPVFGLGDFNVVEADNDAILAFTRTMEADGNEPGEAVLCVNNLSSRPQAATIQLPEQLAGRELIDLFGGSGFPWVAADGRVTLTLGSRDFFWLRLRRRGGPRLMAIVHKGASIVPTKTEMVTDVDAAAAVVPRQGPRPRAAARRRLPLRGPRGRGRLSRRCCSPTTAVEPGGRLPGPAHLPRRAGSRAASTRCSARWSTACSARAGSTTARTTRSTSRAHAATILGPSVLRRGRRRPSAATPLATGPSTGRATGSVSSRGGADAASSPTPRSSAAWRRRRRAGRAAHRQGLPHPRSDGDNPDVVVQSALTARGLRPRAAWPSATSAGLGRPGRGTASSTGTSPSRRSSSPASRTPGASRSSPPRRAPTSPPGPATSASSPPRSTPPSRRRSAPHEATDGGP